MLATTFKAYIQAFAHYSHLTFWSHPTLHTLV
jgi:hypothetical protein